MVVLAHIQYQPHKDYLGHIFRWGFASRFVNKKSKVLDIGCGQEQPFARSLGGSNPNTVPTLYLGIDLNKISMPVTRKNFYVMDETNFIDEYKRIRDEYGRFSIIVNFEVFEHMSLKFGRKLLKRIRKMLDKKGVFIFSTPIYSDQYKMAKNHINEMRKSELEDELHKAGFKIIQQFGTFGNWNDLNKVMTNEERDLYKTVGKFYGNELLGCFLSPKYPEAARNVTHICVRDDDDRDECEFKESIIA